MTTTLVLPDSLAAQLSDVVRLDVETGAVLLARPVRDSSDHFRLLARELHFVPDAAYVRRESASLLIKSEGYVPALGRAESTGCIPIWLHTHPGESSSPRRSDHDRRVDAELADLFRLRSGTDYYGALIIARHGAQIRFTGHLAPEDGDSVQIDRMLTVGSRFTIVSNYDADATPLPSLFDRNVRAFGGEVQRVLHDLRIAIVGCGGTGSSVAEQLVRLGVRNFRLVDPDLLSESNVTRVYGSTAADVGRPKVEVLAAHLSAIAPDATVSTVASALSVEATARSLAGSDVVFGCTDDNAGRLVLSRIATYLLTPVIDCGVLLSSNGAGSLDGIHGRVTVLHPGAPCLVCRGRVDLARAGAELLSPRERIRRADEGYAPALPGIEPAVVAFTTLVAASAVAELLERLTGYGVTPVPSEVILRIHDREISTNEARPADHHYCNPSSGKMGLGITRPFLEQTWTA